MHQGSGKAGRLSRREGVGGDGARPRRCQPCERAVEASAGLAVSRRLRFSLFAFRFSRRGFRLSGLRYPRTSSRTSSRTPSRVARREQMVFNLFQFSDEIFAGGDSDLETPFAGARSLRIRFDSLAVAIKSIALAFRGRYGPPCGRSAHRKGLQVRMWPSSQERRLARRSNGLRVFCAPRALGLIANDRERQVVVRGGSIGGRVSTISADLCVSRESPAHPRGLRFYFIFIKFMLDRNFRARSGDRSSPAFALECSEVA